jgi:hypothetical protein
MENPAVPNPGPGSFLQERRFRISLGIAVVEGILVVLGWIPYWAVFIVAVAGGAYWYTAGRHSTSPMVRQASWILAASQIFLVLVPVFFKLFKPFAYALVAILAIVALIFLFTERERRA